VPGDDVERGVRLGAVEESAEALVHNLPTAVRVEVEGCHGVLKVAGVGETIGAQRAQFGKLIVLALEIPCEDSRAYVSSCPLTNTSWM
jgi:hypothetical protein